MVVSLRSVVCELLPKKIMWMILASRTFCIKVDLGVFFSFQKERSGVKILFIGLTIELQRPSMILSRSICIRRICQEQEFSRVVLWIVDVENIGYNCTIVGERI